VNEYVVYPAYGVGKIVAIEERDFAGFDLEVFVIRLARERLTGRLTLMIPVSKAVGLGLRKLAGPEVVQAALEILTTGAVAKRGTWARRAKEYHGKLKSGDLVAVAEVLRDLYRSPWQPEQSGAEREIFELARDRVITEVAVVRQATVTECTSVIEAQLQQRRGRCGHRRCVPESNVVDSRAKEAL